MWKTYDFWDSLEDHIRKYGKRCDKSYDKSYVQALKSYIQALKHPENVFSLTLKDCYIHDTLCIAFQNNKKLRHLEINDCYVSEADLYIILRDGKCLESINFSDTVFGEINESHYLLNEDAAFEMEAIKNLLYLSELIIKNPTFDTTELCMFNEMISYTSNLTKLEVHGESTQTVILPIKITRSKHKYICNFFALYYAPGTEICF